MAGIDFILQNNPIITGINCGNSSPKLGGVINITSYTDLKSIICTNNDITNIQNTSSNTSLEYVNLSFNKITGLLPIIPMTNNLKHFDIRNNLISGFIPNLSSFSPRLEYFNCQDNFISGNFPNIVSPVLTGLRVFVTDNNTQITGYIPALSGLSQLYSFYVNDNNLTGSIPNLNFNPVLNAFSASSNNLTGIIPVLSNNSVLLVFGVQNNLLTGVIPNLDSNTKLIYFLAGGNQLTGSIPNLNKNTDLEYFLTNNNNLTGSIPPLTGNPNLKHFIVNNNKLSGPIPNISSNSKLEAFFVNDNLLTGQVPSLTGNPELQYFRINTNNGLNGNFPSISANTKLINIWTFFNNISGNIPNMSNNLFLDNVNFSYCRFTGFDSSGGVPISLSDFRAENNLLKQSAVDRILDAFVLAGRNYGTRYLNLSGPGNEAPTNGQNNASRLTLLSRGWTVLVNS
jgi:hypothetical protein